MRPYNDVQKCKLTFRETGKINIFNAFLGNKEDSNDKFYF